MSGIYEVSIPVTALNTSADLATIVAAAGKPLRVHMLDIAGQGAATADNTVLVQRSTGGTTGGNAVTPAPTDPGFPAAAFSVYRSWGAQPSLTAATILRRMSVNALNGKDRFQAVPGAEWFIPAGGQLSIRSEAGTSNVVLNMTVEEIG